MQVIKNPSFKISLFLLTTFGLLTLPKLGIADASLVPTKYTIKIVSPSPEDTFQNSSQTIPVVVNVTPNLKEGDNITVLVDGQQIVEPVHDTAITVPWLPRGSHTLQAKVIQKNGSGAESDVVTIYQQRTSVLLPAR